MSEFEASSKFTPVLSCFHIERPPLLSFFRMAEQYVLLWFIAYLRFSGVVNFMSVALQPFNLSPAVWSYCGSERIVC